MGITRRTVDTMTNEIICMADPTYNRKEIEADPVWKLAFNLSAQLNENAPIGWSNYIPEAKWIHDNFLAN